jgi:hypothetical protein
MISIISNAVIVLLVIAGHIPAAAETKRLVSIGPDGALAYGRDEQGNQIPDFSRAGYMGGGVAIPEVPVVEVLSPHDGTTDDTARIQAAIDALSAVEPTKQGTRGALLLKRGLYRVSGILTVSTSGVVIRGEGQGPDGTILLATGKKQRTLIILVGKSAITEVAGSRRKITDSYVPWGASSFASESTDGYRAGDAVIVYRPSTAQWIHDLKMDQIVERKGTVQWRAGGYDLRFERTITSIDGNRITLDAPIVNAMDEKYGGGFVYRYAEEGRLTQTGVEHLRLVSEYQQGRENEDEEHAWIGVTIDHAENSWIRNVSVVHFSHGVGLGSQAAFITVQDCACLRPVSKITGGRRYPFAISGQYCLIQRCYSDHSRHAEATGARVRGPNVFLDCLAENTHADTGPHHRWAVGILWDNLKGGEFCAQDRGNWGTGHGWAGAQQVFWNCETSTICVQRPPTAQNYAIGCTGKIDKGRFPDRDPGYYDSHGEHIQPRSLYLKQLEDRLGPHAVENVTKDAQRNGTIYDVLKKELAQ